MEPTLIQIANYSANGECVGSEAVNARSCDMEQVQVLTRTLSRLSGDLDLPLEEPIVSDPPTVLRICSTFHAAYSVYYVEDSAQFASLILTGSDEEGEFELMQVFKYLLLDESDEEEPSDEAVLELLNQQQFEFDQIAERPAVFQIRLSDDPETDDLSQALSDLDVCVAAAFLAHPQVQPHLE